MTTYENVYENEGNASRYGDGLYNVHLIDGEVSQLYADRIEVSMTGDLLIIGSFRTYDGDSGEENSHGAQMTLAAFAAGTWLRFEAASIMTGGPVFVDRIIAPATP